MAIKVEKEWKGTEKVCGFFMFGCLSQECILAMAKLTPLNVIEWIERIELNRMHKTSMQCPCSSSYEMQ